MADLPELTEAHREAIQETKKIFEQDQDRRYNQIVYSLAHNLGIAEAQVDKEWNGR